MLQRLIFKAIIQLFGITLVFLVTGCASVLTKSVPIDQEVKGKGLVIDNVLPKELPANTTTIAGTHYVLVNADSGVFLLADMANPIPFVGGYVLS